MENLWNFFFQGPLTRVKNFKGPPFCIRPPLQVFVNGPLLLELTLPQPRHPYSKLRHCPLYSSVAMQSYLSSQVKELYQFLPYIFPIFPLFFPIFPDFWQFFRCQGWHSSPVPPGYATAPLFVLVMRNSVKEIGQVRVGRRSIYTRT